MSYHIQQYRPPIILSAPMVKLMLYNIRRRLILRARPKWQSRRRRRGGALFFSQPFVQHRNISRRLHVARRGSKATLRLVSIISYPRRRMENARCDFLCAREEDLCCDDESRICKKGGMLLLVHRPFHVPLRPLPANERCSTQA